MSKPKEPTTPGCKYNPVGVKCDPEGRQCARCGHNPKVAAARTEKIFPGYLTCLQSLPPVETERILGGKWNIPAGEQ